MFDERLLAQAPALGTLPPPARAALARSGIQVSYARGQFLFHAGDPPRGLFLILEGRVRIVNERDGRRHLVHEEGPGATLGEVPLLLGGGYPASAVAASGTRCLLFSRDALHSAMGHSPDLSWFLMRRLAERIRTLVGRLEQVSTTPVLHALAGLLLERARGGTTFSLGATQQELAESLGTVREVVVRQLTTLKRAGVIAPAGRSRFTVPSQARLAAIARGGPV